MYSSSKIAYFFKLEKYLCANIGHWLKEMVTNMSKDKITNILRDKYTIFDEFGDISNWKIQVGNVLIKTKHI